MCQFHLERTISLRIRLEDIYIYGYATIRGGRKYFIRGVERKKDLGFEEFRPNFLRFSLPGENYSSSCTLISNELITSLILLIFSKLGVA